MNYEALVSENQRLQRQRAELQEENQQLKQQLTEAQEQIAALRRQLFGPKAEKLSVEQQEQLEELQQDLTAATERPEALSEEVLGEEEPRPERARRRRARQPLPEHLEEETVEIEPNLEPCPGCGKMPEKIGEEVTEEIDYIPARLIRRKIVRSKYGCRCGAAGVTIAALPPRLISQSRLGLGLATHITLARFDDHLSFYRLEQQFRERHGMVIPRQQMVQWTEHIALWLQPLYDAMWREMRAGGYLQVDETPVRVMDPEVRKKAARGYLWFYAVPRGDVLLVFDPSRSLKPVQERLRDFQGTIQTDAYEVYNSLCRKQIEVQRIGCLAHARRKFYEALQENLSLAVWFIGRIRQLYAIEKEIRTCLPEVRQKVRRQKAPILWSEMLAKAKEIGPQLLPKSSLGKAVQYFLNEYESLIGYLRDGRFEIDNNLVENAIRPTVVGRKRWLFLGHPDAGWRSAVIYSLLISCRRRGINPQEYLTDVLGRLPSATTSQLSSLLPSNWKPTNPNTG
jgi:transposase